MATQAIPLGEEKAVFRVCPVTRLRVDLAAERMIIANATAAVVFLLVGGIMGLLLALTRWEAIHLLPATWYYRLVTAHGFNMLVAWIVFFEVAGLYFGSTVLLNARLVSPRAAQAACALMLLGALLVNAIVLAGQADVMFTAYVPLKAHPLFYLGVILFALGALTAVVLFFADLFIARLEGRYTGSVPLVVFGLATAGIIATYTLLSGAIAFIPAFFWSLGWLRTYDPGFYRNLFWGFGHPAQQINLAAMVAVWYALAAITVGANPINEKLSRLAFVLYILFINLGAAHHLLVDPGLSFAWKMFNTSYAMYLAVLGSLIHAFSIPAAVEVALRRQGYHRGLFEWLRQAPWQEPGFAALVVSMILFGWLGGVSGVIIGTEQLNMQFHNTLAVPGHFHATVVGGTTLAFMGLTYYLIPLIFRRELRLKRLAAWQPYVFGFGMLLLILGFLTSGTLGVPRRHWGVFTVPAIFPTLIPEPAQLTLAMAGIGGVIATIGGAMFVLVVLSSVLTGTVQEARSLRLVVADAADPSEAGEAAHVEPRGTFLIVLAFLIFFVLVYFRNWWMLGIREWLVH